MKKLLATGALVALGIASLAGFIATEGGALAEVPALFLTNLTGNEQINVLGLGPQIETVTTSTLRNTTGYQLSIAATGTVTTTALTDNLLLSQALTGAVTVDLPPSPPDAQLFSVTNVTGSNFTSGVTVATTDGSTINSGASVGDLNANTGAEFQYTAASKVWYRLR